MLPDSSFSYHLGVTSAPLDEWLTKRGKAEGDVLPQTGLMAAGSSRQQLQALQRFVCLAS